MPSTYAHRRFGANVLEHLPDEVRVQLEMNRELYDIDTEIGRASCRERV